MRRAGRAVFDAILHGWPDAGSLSICCGKGNNAGDGYVVAGLALERGMAVELIQVGDPGALGGDAAAARDDALARGLRVIRTDDGACAPAGDVIVDALIGTGLRGAATGAFAALIEAMNASGRPVVAVDIPSGVEADTGAAAGPAVRAEQTVTFIGRKIGLVTGAGAALSGHVHFAELGVGNDVRRHVTGLDWLTLAGVLERFGLPGRDANAYKQALGHVVVVGGDESMGGAPLMAAEAALRTGAGMVTVVTRAAHRNAVLSRRPEVMVADADDPAQRDEVLGRASTLIVGPGLGRRSWGESLLGLALAQEKPTLIDADGLYHLAAGGSAPAGTIVTPHTGEAAMLLGCASAEVQRDRIGAASALADRVGGVAVLKGAGSVLASAIAGQSRPLGICAHGNPGMATAGMGDVLAGIIGGLLAQNRNPEAAALLGTCAHSLAADHAADRLGEASLLATDIFVELMALLKSAAAGPPGGG